MSNPHPNDGEFRRGWAVVLACFCTAVFAWGFGFYGQAVYLAELQRLHGWPSAWISGATTWFYLCGALLMPFVHWTVARAGPRAVMLTGVLVLGGGAVLFSRSAAPWQMFAAGTIMAIGWAAASTTAIATSLALWFDRRRGLAISLALNGASASGFTIAPILVHLSQAIGLPMAVPWAVSIGLALTIPIVLLGVRRPPQARGSLPGQAALAPDPRPAYDRGQQALRDRRFWLLALPFALAIAAQVGFIVHMVAFLLPGLGASGAGIAVGVSSIAAMAGRLILGIFIHRLPHRRTSAASFAFQACGLGLMAAWPTWPPALYAGTILFGLSVGNVITLPAIIVQREFAARSFGLVVGLSGAVAQFTLAFAPGLFGLLHDAAGGYGSVLATCIALQLLAALLILRIPDAGQPRPRNNPNAANVVSDT